jgi:hypothetical protein
MHQQQQYQNSNYMNHITTANDSISNEYNNNSQNRNQYSVNSKYINNLTTNQNNNQTKMLNKSPNIIADALHLTYSTDKGRFNLEEAARHISNEWNKIRAHLIAGKF